METSNICIIKDFSEIIESKNKLSKRIEYIKNKLQGIILASPNNSLDGIFTSSCYLKSDFLDFDFMIKNYNTKLKNQIILHDKKMLFNISNLYFNLKKFYNDNSLGIIFLKSFDYEYILLSKKSEDIFKGLSGGKYKNLSEIQKIIDYDEEDDELPF